MIVFKKSSENNVMFLELTLVVTSLILLIIIYLPNVARHQPSVNGGGVVWRKGRLE
jgi:competence protein ComGC